MVRVANEKSASVRTSPLYLWVASLLRDSIEAGELGPNDPVPSERALSEKYGISRMTARHALETLMLEGYVARDARRGTFVAEPRLRFSVGSFTRIMAEGDHVPGCEVLTASTLDPDPLISEMLELPPGGRIHLVQRLRTAKGEPIAIENIHVSAQRFPDLLEFDLTGSLWEILRSHYGAHPTKADARVVAVTLDRFEAETLKVKAGSPAIALTRTVYGAEGEVVELARDVYRGDRAEFYVTAPVDTVPPAAHHRSRS
jgi:GntR family transcriptional regulator